MKNIIREKSHRLPPEFYRGCNAISLTACINNRIPFFTSPDRFRVFENMLIDALKRFDCISEVYLFMRIMFIL